MRTCVQIASMGGVAEWKKLCKGRAITAATRNRCYKRETVIITVPRGVTQNRYYNGFAWHNAAAELGAKVHCLLIVLTRADRNHRRMLAYRRTTFWEL